MGWLDGQTRAPFYCSVPVVESSTRVEEYNSVPVDSSDLDFKPLGLVAVLSFLSPLGLTVGDGTLIYCYGESCVFITFFQLPFLITTDSTVRCHLARKKGETTAPAAFDFRFIARLRDLY